MIAIICTKEEFNFVSHQTDPFKFNLEENYEPMCEFSTMHEEYHAQLPFFYPCLTVEYALEVIPLCLACLSLPTKVQQGCP